jgi:2Fe-2S ferredoxin
VTVEPRGVVVDLEDGETILAAARRQGINWPSLCGGEADCTTCSVKIVEGLDRLPAPESMEIEALMEKQRVEAGEIRLACQLVPAGDITVHKRAIKHPPTG